MWPWLGPLLVIVQYVYVKYFWFCGRRHVFTQRTEWARIKDDVVLWSLPDGGTGGEVAAYNCRLVYLRDMYRNICSSLPKDDVSGVLCILEGGEQLNGFYKAPTIIYFL